MAPNNFKEEVTVEEPHMEPVEEWKRVVKGLGVMVDDSEWEALEDWEGQARRSKIVDEGNVVDVRTKVEIGDEVRVSVKDEEGEKVVEGQRDTVEDCDDEGRGENERVVSPLVG